MDHSKEWNETVHARETVASNSSYYIRPQPGGSVIADLGELK